MTTQTLSRAFRAQKPAVIKENGKPRFVVLDWDTYAGWQEAIGDWEDTIRFENALKDSQNQKTYSLEEIRKKYNLR